jgi:hypothetical protein
MHSLHEMHTTEVEKIIAHQQTSAEGKGREKGSVK